MELQGASLKFERFQISTVQRITRINEFSTTKLAFSERQTQWWNAYIATKQIKFERRSKLFWAEPINNGATGRLQI